MSFVLPQAVEERAYQTRIRHKAVDLLKDHDSVLIQSPTGSGKTVMGMAIAAQIHAETGMSVGWCAMRRRLLAQAREENIGKGFNIPNLKLVSMFDKEPPPCDLLIVDEAQHDGALSMANIHSKIRPKRILGLTATPFRTDRIKLCFQKQIRDAGIHELINDGYLSRFRHYTIPTYTPADVAAHYVRGHETWGQTLIFFHNMRDCLECADRIRAAGLSAEVVTGKTDNERQLEDFTAGKHRAVIGMLLLTEGFDYPGLETVFVRPSGKLCTIQMAGRVLRKFHSINFKNIVQCESTKHPFPRTATPSEQYVWMNEQWRGLSVNPHIEQISRQMHKTLATIDVKLPDSIRKATEKKSRHSRRGAVNEVRPEQMGDM